MSKRRRNRISRSRPGRSREGAGIKRSEQELLASRPEWRDRAYREAYASEAIHQALAWQIKLNREHRGLSQEQLAALIQVDLPVVCELEDADHGHRQLDTLAAVAKAFDCALLVKFVSYAELHSESQRLSAADQHVTPFGAGPST